jgi:hypothetical protein
VVGDPTAAPGTEADGDPTERRRTRPVARILVGVYVVVGIVVIGVGVFASRLDHGTADRAVAVDATTTTSAPARPITTTVTTVPPPVPTTPPVEVVAPPPDTEPPPPPPPPRPDPPGATISVTPEAPQSYPGTSAPVLAWDTAGASTIVVAGPGVESNDPSGSIPVCPTDSSSDWAFCTAPPGEYVYVITVSGSDGAVFSASATLTIA